MRSDGRIVGGAFKTTNEFPTLRRDGAMLVISAEEPDDGKNDKPESDYASYCNRMPSAKARLFPVKAAAGVGGDFSRLR